jgi:hypothetical protein
VPSFSTVAGSGENMIPNIETAVWIGKRFGKAFVEADAKSFASRARPRLTGSPGRAHGILHLVNA